MKSFLAIIAATYGLLTCTVTGKCQVADPATTRPSLLISLPTCDPELSQGLLNVLQVKVENKGDVALHRAILECEVKAHFDDLTKNRLSLELLRFSYDHRHDQSSLMKGAFVAEFGRSLFQISPGAIAGACIPYLVDSDEEIRDTAAQMLEHSGIFDITTDSTGQHFMANLAEFINSSTPAERRAVSGSFIRQALVHDPMLVCYALDKLETSDGQSSGLGSNQDFQYIQWAMQQMHRADSKDGEQSLASDLLDRLSVSATFTSRLFVLGVMDQYAGPMKLPPMLNTDILNRLKKDDDSFVRSVADSVSHDIDKRTEEIRRNSNNDDPEMRRTKLGIIDLDQPVSNVNLTACFPEHQVNGNNVNYDLKSGQSVSWELLPPYRIPDQIIVSWLIGPNNGDGKREYQTIELRESVKDLDHFYGTLWLRLAKGRWQAVPVSTEHAEQLKRQGKSPTPE